MDNVPDVTTDQWQRWVEDSAHLLILYPDELDYLRDQGRQLLVLGKRTLDGHTFLFVEPVNADAPAVVGHERAW